MITNNKYETTTIKLQVVVEFTITSKIYDDGKITWNACSTILGKDFADVRGYKTEQAAMAAVLMELKKFPIGY